MKKKVSKSADCLAFEKLLETARENSLQIRDTHGKDPINGNMVKEATGAKSVAKQERKDNRYKELNDLSSLFDLLNNRGEDRQG